MLDEIMGNLSVSFKMLNKTEKSNNYETTI